MKKSTKIWMDGDLVKWDNANIHILTHTMHYGLGLFEGIRCYNTVNGPAVFRLNEHIDRLFYSAKIVDVSIPFSKKEVINAIIDLIKINNLTECYIRPIVYFGTKKIGLNTAEIDIHLAIAAWHWGTYLGDGALHNGISTKISSYTRPHTSLTKAKICGNYVYSLVAKAEAIKNGYDEAIFLDTNGNVLEGSGENIFIVRKGSIYTPPPTLILEGITRDSIIQIARDKGILVKEETFLRDDLYIAEEAFFTGTAAEVTPINKIDKRTIGNGSLGTITKKIQDTFFSIVKGQETRYNNWLTYI